MLRIENISKSFGTKTVLSHLNMEIQDGSIYGLVGVNGAGKSTLLRIIAGVYQADEGKIDFNGYDTYTDAGIRREIAYVSDDVYYPLGASLATTKQLYQSLYNFQEDAFQKYLDLFELDEKQRYSTMSKGMKRKASLLFALSIHAKLILLDEAYDGLEPIARRKFREALADLIEDQHVSVIISSHSLLELEDICDSFGMLNNGSLTSYGDLIEKRSNLNKYQLAFQNTPDRSMFHDFNILKYEEDGHIVKLVIRGNTDEVTSKLKTLHPLILDTMPVNFEEMFIYEVEGQKHE